MCKKIPAPIAVEGKQLPPGEDILEMFKAKGNVPREEPISVEEAQKIREAHLQGKPIPRPKQPAQAPVKPAEKAVPHQAPEWSPVASHEGIMVRRLRFVCVLCLLLSILSSAVWVATQTGDITKRLAWPIILACHLTSVTSFLVASLKK